MSSTGHSFLGYQAYIFKLRFKIRTTRLIETNRCQLNMEIIHNERYMRRRHYQRLKVNIKHPRVTRLGGRRNRYLKIIRKLKLGFKAISPIKLLGKFREAYINTMFSHRGNAGTVSGETAVGQPWTPVPSSVRNLKVSKREEFETKLISELYTALMGWRELASL